MKRLLFCMAVLLIPALLSAQPVTPARPADPNQALPAEPVLPNPPAPAAIPATVSPSANPPEANASPVAISIIADSSLKKVLQELAQNWADSLDAGPRVPLTLTNAGTMRTKVEEGPGWDVVISADVEDVKEMTARGAVLADGQRSLARNTVVIYGRNALIKEDELEWFDLIGSEWKKVALGNPDLVASGRVAKHALQKHGLMDDDHKNIFIYAANEASAVGVVEQEQADAVFAYKTDMAGITLPGFQFFALKTEEAPPVFYTAAVCSKAKNPTLARSFIAYCSGEAARATWAKYGFETD